MSKHAIENDLKDKDKIKKYLIKAMDEVDRLSYLIEDVLNLSNIEYKRNVILKQSCDLVAIIDECIESLSFLAEKNRVKIEFKHDTDTIGILTDEELIQQLFRNLLENSIFHGGKGINIKIILGQNDSDVIIEIIDNGVGIDKKDLPFVFQRFYRGKNIFSTRKIGSGLGLSIVKHIVELHKGKITVSSVPGSETRFTIMHTKGIIPDYRCLR